jgi:hypothetical protein
MGAHLLGTRAGAGARLRVVEGRRLRMCAVKGRRGRVRRVGRGVALAGRGRGDNLQAAVPAGGAQLGHFEGGQLLSCL